MHTEEGFNWVVLDGARQILNEIYSPPQKDTIASDSQSLKKNKKKHTNHIV